MTTTELAGDGIDALRSDGGSVHLRNITSDDAPDIRALHARTSNRSIYLRFFSSSRATAECYVAKLIRPNGYDHHGLAALVNGKIVGVGSFERINPDTAEIALLIDDTRHHQGIGTLLLERLITVARQAGIRKLLADVLTENNLMAEVLRHLGYPMSSETDHGTTEVVFDISPDRGAALAAERRGRVADAASLTAVLAPRSIAVIVGPDRCSPIEGLLLDNIMDGGFTGSVCTVGPDRGPAARVTAVPTLTELPQAPDLAIIIDHPHDAIAEIHKCGLAGVKAVFVPQGSARIGSESARVRSRSQAAVAAHSHGMRLLGPDCAGVFNTDPGVRLNATLANVPMLAGGFGLVAQSGELGLAVLMAALSSGVGVSQFVSVGDGADVGLNDLLMRWADDPATHVVGLVLDHLDDAARFQAIAHQLTQHVDVVALVPPDRFGRGLTTLGRTNPGAVRAVLRGSGVCVAATTRELIQTVGGLLRHPRIDVTPPPTTLAAKTPPVGGEHLDHDRIVSLLHRYGVPYVDSTNCGPADEEKPASIVIGASRDPNYGPLIRLERADDDRPEVDEFATVPASTADAHALIARTGRARLLDGRAPLPELSPEALSELLVRVSSLVVRLGEVSGIEFTVIPTAPLTVTFAEIGSNAVE